MRESSILRLGGKRLTVALALLPILTRVVTAFLPTMPLSQQQPILAQVPRRRDSSSVFMKEVLEEVTPTETTKKRPPVQRYHQTWYWRGHKINYRVEGEGRPILLVHGFGASVNHFRNQFDYLPKLGYKVYAIDLLGFGGSDKPSSVDVYELELWRDQVVDFMNEFEGGKGQWVIAGNSIGGLISLMVSATAPQFIKGCVLLNAAGGLVSFRDDELPWYWRPVWTFVRTVLFGDLVGPSLFRKFRTEDNVRDVLNQVYKNPDAVDDELVEILCEPGGDEGAEQVFLKVLRGPAGPTPEATLPLVKAPIIAIWGEDDPWTPMSGGMHPGVEFHKYNPNFRLYPLPNTGHCPHDERPEEVHKILTGFLKEIYP